MCAWHPAGLEVSPALFVNKAADIAGKAISRWRVEVGVLWIVSVKVIEHLQEGLLVLL